MAVLPKKKATSVSECSSHEGIKPNDLYSFPRLRAQGIGTAALKQLRRLGLRVRFLGRNGYALGSDVIETILSKCPEKRYRKRSSVKSEA